MTTIIFASRKCQFPLICSINYEQIVCINFVIKICSDFEFDDADSTQNFVTPDSLQQHAVIIDNYDDETAFFDDYATFVSY